MKFSLRALFRLTAAVALLVWLVLALPRVTLGAVILAAAALVVVLTALLSLAIVGLAIAICHAAGKLIEALDFRR